MNPSNVPQTADTQQRRNAWQIQKIILDYNANDYNKTTSQVTPMASGSERSAVCLPELVAKWKLIQTFKWDVLG